MTQTFKEAYNSDTDVIEVSIEQNILIRVACIDKSNWDYPGYHATTINPTTARELAVYLMQLADEIESKNAAS